MEWALATPEPTDADRPLRKVGGKTRDLLIEALEFCVVEGACEMRRMALFRTLRSLKLARLLDEVQEERIREAAVERLKQLSGPAV